MSSPRRRARTDTIAEARFLLSCGESVAQVVAALGISIDTLVKSASLLGASDVNEAITAYKMTVLEYRRAA